MNDGGELNTDFKEVICSSKCKGCGITINKINGYTIKQHGKIYFRRWCRFCYNNNTTYDGTNYYSLYMEAMKEMPFIKKIMPYSVLTHYIRTNNIKEVTKELVSKKIREYNSKWLTVEENNKAYKEYKEAGGDLCKNRFFKRANDGEEDIKRLPTTKPQKPINPKEVEIYKDYLSFKRGGIYKTKASYIEEKYGIQPKKLRNLVSRYFFLRKSGHIQI